MIFVPRKMEGKSSSFGRQTQHPMCRVEPYKQVVVREIQNDCVAFQSFSFPRVPRREFKRRYCPPRP